MKEQTASGRLLGIILDLNLRLNLTQRKLQCQRQFSQQSIESVKTYLYKSAQRIALLTIIVYGVVLQCMALHYLSLLSNIQCMPLYSRCDTYIKFVTERVVICPNCI